MERDRQTIGKRGEQKAQNYLKCRGYRILDCNYRIKGGELDIIAEHKGCIVFVEVKTRTNDNYGTPAEAVSFYKQKHMLHSAKCYLQRYDTEVECRFDVIEVIFQRKGLFWQTTIHHLKNVIQ